MDETPLPVPARLLHNLFDVLGEQAGNALEWREALFDRDGAHALNEYEARERIAELGLWLFELEGDLDDWQRTLAPLLGRGDDLPDY